MIYSHKISDFKKYEGTFFKESWFTTIISDSGDGEYINDTGEKKVLFRFRKKVFSKQIMGLAVNSFLQESKKKHSNRGMASGIVPGNTTARITNGNQNEGQYSSSNISGYFDRPLREHRGKLGTATACRTTAFTLKNKELWESGLPFIQKCSREYSKLGGKYYSRQSKEYHHINPKIRIPNTVFTTVTSNYNWRTACHTDAGDYSGGLGNLIVVGNGFTGGYLGFPQFKILIKIEPGDFLLMDNHQYHCNTPIKLIDPLGFRLSFVMYIRSNMSKCTKPKRILNTDYYLK